MLRSRFIATALSLVLLLCSFALPASAAVLDYNDYISNITVDGTYDNVTLKFPESGVWYGAGTGYNHEELYVNLDSSRQTVYYAPFLYIDGVPDSLKRTDFPDDTQFELRFACRSQNVPDAGYLLFYQFDSSGRLINPDDYEVIPLEIDSVGYLDYSIVTLRIGSLNFVDECYSFNFTYQFSVPGVQSSSGGSGDYTYWYYFWGADFNFSFKIDSLVRQQQNTNKQNAILNAVEKRLAEQGKTLDEVLQQQQQTNDKLDGIQGGIDDTNDKLETLPGQIGDEMQGIIDNEKEESKSEGNKFVDQILDALPDPSTDVLAALKGLTDATAYTGTDAVLPIPAIVLPGIDGLFPQTEIWGGTQFDFGEYIGMLPPALLNLVQSLFTIAIVLFCVYELKGIISYCLTLRENKGG